MRVLHRQMTGGRAFLALASYTVMMGALVVVNQLAFEKGSSLFGERRVSAAADNVVTVSSLVEFNKRKDSWTNAVIAQYGANRDDQGITGLALMERAARTGDLSRIREANDRLVAAARYIDDPDHKGDRRPAYEGYALIFANAVLKYGSMPEIMYPTTLEKLKNGVEVAGSGYPSNSNESLRFFHRMIAYSDDRKIGLGRYNPWTNLGTGTENHKLQEIASGIMISKIYANERYSAPDGTFPFYDTTVAADDYYHYWQDAFLRWLTKYGERDTDTTLTRHIDAGLEEKDSTHYVQTYLGDLWLIREYAENSTVKKYAEIFLDLVLADMAEEYIGGLYTGSHSRGYDMYGMSKGPRTIFVSPMVYLLYEGLPYSISDLGWPVCGWGCWANGAILTSNYNPTHSEFPLVITDVLLNKPSAGYQVMEASNLWSGVPAELEHNWVTSRYAIGFQLRHGCYSSSPCGGVYINDDKGVSGGVVMAPFVGDDPDYRYGPDSFGRGVVGPGAAIVRVTENDTTKTQADLPSKIWVRNGWLERTTSGQWMFYRSRSIDGKEVYAAVRPALGGYTRGTPVNGGEVYVMTTPDDFWVFDVADQDRFANFSNFRTAVLAATFSTSWPNLEYRSSSGTTVRYNRSNGTRWVNGVEFADSDYSFVIKNPWMEWKIGAREANLAKNARSAFYDFDANNDGVFNDPVKRVSNGQASVGAPTPTATPQVTGVVPSPTTAPAITSVPPTVPPTYPTATPAVSGSRINQLQVLDAGNAGDWSVQPRLEIGMQQFGDRTYKLLGLPSIVAGKEWIRTAADSKTYTADPIVKFGVSAASRVYVAHDKRVNPKPGWMTGWTDTGQDITSDAPGSIGFRLYYKDYSGGSTVSLGNNGNTSQLMYMVVVVEGTTQEVSGFGNWGFDTGSAGYWNLTSPSGTATFNWLGSEGYGKAGAVRLVGSSASLARWMTNNELVKNTTWGGSVVSGNTYVARVRVKTNNVTGKGAYLHLGFWNGSGGSINYLGGGSSGVLTGNNDWTLLTRSVVAPAGTTWVRIELRLEGSGEVFWDDVYLQ